jgi:hypothetical protein
MSETSPRKPIRSLCVFCGSKTGVKREYALAAWELGQVLGSNGIRLVYGGGGVGLMGEVAKSVRDAGGQVIGIIPEFLCHTEGAESSASELIVVNTMHERKQMMNALCDGFLILPGGVGTLEEFFEVYSWAYLNLHQKPIGLLNTAKFFEPLLVMLRHMRFEGFVADAHMALVQEASTPAELFRKVKAVAAGEVAEEVPNQPARQIRTLDSLRQS